MSSSILKITKNEEEKNIKKSLGKTTKMEDEQNGRQTKGKTTNMVIGQRLTKEREFCILGTRCFFPFPDIGLTESICDRKMPSWVSTQAARQRDGKQQAPKGQ